MIVNGKEVEGNYVTEDMLVTENTEIEVQTGNDSGLFLNHLQVSE